jgi:hypothetical protein
VGGRKISKPNLKRRMIMTKTTKIVFYTFLSVLFVVGLWGGTILTKRFMLYEFESTNFSVITKMTVPNATNIISLTGNTDYDISEFVKITNSKVNGRVVAKVAITANGENIYRINYWFGNDVENEKQRYDGFYISNEKVLLGVTQKFVLYKNIVINENSDPWTYTPEVTFKGNVISSKYKSYGLFYNNKDLETLGQELSSRKSKEDAIKQDTRALQDLHRNNANAKSKEKQEMEHSVLIERQMEENRKRTEEREKQESLRREEELRKIEQKNIVLYNETKGMIVALIDEMKLVDLSNLTEMTIKRNFCTDNISIVRLSDDINNNLGELPDNLKNDIINKFPEYSEYINQYNDFIKWYSISRTKKDKWDVYVAKINDPNLRRAREREEMEARANAERYKRDCEARANDRKARYVKSLPPIVMGIGEVKR